MPAAAAEKIRPLFVWRSWGERGGFRGALRRTIFSVDVWSGAFSTQLRRALDEGRDARSCDGSATEED
jgi:hypothetical protein